MKVSDKVKKSFDGNYREGVPAAELAAATNNPLWLAHLYLAERLREDAVLRAQSSGKTVKEVAEELGLSVPTAWRAQQRALKREQLERGKKR
jgi:DNA-binding NarL/FixJ family response regulator